MREQAWGTAMIACNTMHLESHCLSRLSCCGTQPKRTSTLPHQHLYLLARV